MKKINLTRMSSCLRREVEASKLSFVQAEQIALAYLNGYRHGKVTFKEACSVATKAINAVRGNLATGYVNKWAFLGLFLREAVEASPEASATRRGPKSTPHFIEDLALELVLEVRLREGLKVGRTDMIKGKSAYHQVSKTLKALGLEHSPSSVERLATKARKRIVSK